MTLEEKRFFECVKMILSELQEKPELGYELIGESFTRRVAVVSNIVVKMTEEVVIGDNGAVTIKTPNIRKTIDSWELELDGIDITDPALLRMARWFARNIEDCGYTLPLKLTKFLG